MSQPKRTKSELLFEEICRAHGVECDRVPEGQRKRPDYELRIAGHRVIAEVKQTDPNDADGRFSESLHSKGHASGVVNPDNVADRIRDDIDQSRSQINSYWKANPPAGPALLIVFNNTDFHLYDDPYIIQTAMFGFEHVVLEVGGARTVAIERGFAPRNNAEVRTEKNRQLSALVTLHEYTDFESKERRLGLVFYHNPYSDFPFEAASWSNDCVSHKILSPTVSDQFQDWEEVQCE